MVSFIFKGRAKVYGYQSVLFWNRVCLCAFWTAVSYHFKTMYFSRVIIQIYDNGDLKQIEAISGPDPVCRVREITYRISSNDSRQ